MNHKDKEELVGEIEKSHVLIRKGDFYRFVGGFLASGVAIVGLSYAAAKSVVESAAASIAADKINELKIKAEIQTKQISQILAGTPNMVSRVESGTCQSDYEKIKYTGESRKRESICIINFSPPFKKLPMVLTGLSEINTDKNGIAQGLRLKIEVGSVAKNGANIKFETWHHTDIYGSKVRWVAIGQ